jgi:2,4-dienoyl-CoA reductase (NADPH2)
MGLLKPVDLGNSQAPNGVMFGPHVTNLGTDERTFSDQHIAYYARRAQGGCGVIVLEGMSVHHSDWPYERAPLASHCAESLNKISQELHKEKCLVIASLDHSGGQGTSAYHQQPLWAPSRVPEVNSREVPKWMEQADIDEVIEGFVLAARIAVSSGCDGVEINAGQHSLVRQFLSGLTNHRDDAWGQDKTLFARTIIEKVREAIGDAVIGLRLSCDELAPWAGITPDMAVELASQLTACGLDYLVVVRGSIFSVEKTRPDFHEPEGFNTDITQRVQAVLNIPVFLQGSIVQPHMAMSAVEQGVCAGVEMTRAQIADPDLVNKMLCGDTAKIRPCIRCNQTCQVRDARNPIVTCVVEPTSGHENTDPNWYAQVAPKKVAVIGAGPAGLEAAYTAARRGHSVEVYEKQNAAGGIAAFAGPGATFVHWLYEQCLSLDVQFHFGVAIDGTTDLAADVVLQCTGSRLGVPTYAVTNLSAALDVVDVMNGSVALPESGDIVLHDPIGGPIAIALAQWLGQRAILVTPDNIAGNELSRSGDLAPANVRLAQQGTRVVKRALVRSVTHSGQGVCVEVQDRYSGETTVYDAAAFIDCGFRLPTEHLSTRFQLVGDAVAPRTVLEAVLEARRAVFML